MRESRAPMSSNTREKSEHISDPTDMEPCMEAASVSSKCEE